MVVCSADSCLQLVLQDSHRGVSCSLLLPTESIPYRQDPASRLCLLLRRDVRVQWREEGREGDDLRREEV